MVKYTPVSHDPFAENKSRIPAANALASAGRMGDTLLIHATPGDVGIPAEMRNDAVDAQLRNILGDKFDQYTAGSSANSRNPQTNLIEFGDDGEGGAGSGGGNSGNDGPGGSPGGGAGDPNGASAPGAPDATGLGSDSPAPGATAPDNTGISGTGTAPTGNESETAVNDPHDPAVSNTVTETGLSGLVNDISNKLQSKLSEFQNDPFGTTAAVLGNLALGFATSGVSTAVNAGLALMGKPSIAEMGVGLVEGAMNSSTSTSAPTDASTLGGLSLGALGSPGGTGEGDETDNNALLNKFYQSLMPPSSTSGTSKVSHGASVIDIGQLAGLPSQSPSIGTNTKQYL